MYLNLSERDVTREAAPASARCPPAAPLSPSRRGVAAPRADAGALLPRYRPLTYRGRPERWAGVLAGGVKGVVPVEGERGAPRGGSVARRSERETTESSLKRSGARAPYLFLYFSEGLWVLSCSKRILQLLGQRVHCRRRMLAIDEKLAHSQ